MLDLHVVAEGSVLERRVAIPTRGTGQCGQLLARVEVLRERDGGALVLAEPQVIRPCTAL